MTYLIYSLIAVGIIIIIVKILPKQFAVQRDITVNQSQQNTLPYIYSLRKMDEWSVWNIRDAEIEKEYTGEDGQEGFLVTWKDNDKMGQGEQQIVKLIDDKPNRILGRKSELRFFKPWPVTNESLLLAEKIDDNTTRIIWTLHGKLTLPANIFMSPKKMDKVVGKDFEQSLKNLKKILESIDYQSDQ